MGLSVNQVKDPGGVASMISLEEWLSVCEKVVESDRVELVLLHPNRKWVALFFGGVVDWHWCVLVLSRLCGFNGIACGLPVGLWWSVNISLRTGIVEKEDGMCPGPLPFWPSFQAIEMHTSGFSLQCT